MTPPPGSDHSPDEQPSAPVPGTGRLRRLPDPPVSHPTPTEGLPPATVLHDAADAHPAAAPDGDTHRVRLIPRIPNPPPWRLILLVDGPGQSRIGLDVRRPLTLGRIDASGANDADLDLTPYLASEHGVSRQHCILIPGPDALFLGDLQSANGTWVNGSYLEPGERYVLVPGDTVELGLLKFSVVSVAPIVRGVSPD